MRKIIHHLRRQPEDTRVQILHILTLISGVALFALWVYSLGNGLTNEETKASVVETVQPFSILRDNLIDGYESFAP